MIAGIFGFSDVEEASATIAPHLYEVAWREQPLDNRRGDASARRRWLVVGGDGGVGRQLVAQLEARGQAAQLAAEPFDAASAPAVDAIVHLGAQAGVRYSLFEPALGVELAAKDDVARKGPANFYLDRLGGVVADALGVGLMIIPAGDGGVRADLHAWLTDAEEYVGAVSPHPDFIA